MVKPTERRVGYGVALGYGITDLFGGGAFAIIGTWLLFLHHLLRALCRRSGFDICYCSRH